MVILVKRENLIRATQLYEYIVSIILTRCNSYCFVAFLNYPSLSIESESIFFAQKNISLSVTLETVC